MSAAPVPLAPAPVAPAPVAPRPWLVRATPSLVTLAGLAAGSLTILLARPASEGPPLLAASLLVLAVCCDFADGLLARALDARSDFGRELDSLSDVVCFGVAPASLLHDALSPALGAAGTASAILFLLAAALRLARFNVTSAAPGADARWSLGLTAPMGAAAAVAMTCLSPGPVPLALTALALASLMVSRVPYRTTKGLDLGVPGAAAPLAALVVLDALVVALALGPVALLALAALGNALAGPLGWLVATAVRRARTQERGHVG